MYRHNLARIFSGSPKLHPSKPHPCKMPQANTEVALQFSECCAAEVALQTFSFCSAEVVFTKSCAAASEKLQRNIEKAALQESGAFLPLTCEFQAPTFRHPRLGPADLLRVSLSREVISKQIASKKKMPGVLVLAGGRFSIFFGPPGPHDFPGKICKILRVVFPLGGPGKPPGRKCPKNG